MPGPWYPASDLEGDVRQILKEDTLEDYWPPLCAKAAETAYADLAGVLLGKGYTIAQLDQWDFRRAYSRQQALFWLYTESSLGIGYDDKEINKLDRRKELTESATILINGAAVGYGSDSAGGVGGGVIAETNYRITGETRF